MSQAFSNNLNSFNKNIFGIHNSIVIADSFNRTALDESKILAWLSPLEPWVRHRDIGAQRIDSIGSWLLETGEFRRWRGGGGEGGSDHAILYCEGNPGAGKSHIISLVIDKLCDEAEEEDAAVVCFYFDFASRSEQSAANMLGSLLRQLVGGLDKVPEMVVQAFRKQKKVIGGRGLQVSGILKMFQTITAAKRTFVCVDALDECVPGQRMVVLESLRQILQGSPNTRIFVTGRPHVQSEVVGKLGTETTFVSIQPMEDGVVRFLRGKLRNDTAPYIMSSSLEANIMKYIPEISSETFLLASLYIDAILRETTIARRAKRLRSINDGAGLEDVYGVTLERIKAQGGEKAKLAITTLTWICHSERPLEVDELCHALAVEIGETDFDFDNVPSIGTVLDCCQGLIAVDKEASTVRLIHFTVQEYLFTLPDLFSKPHSMIAEACLTYLNSKQLKNLPAHPLPDHQNIPFLKYSSRYWGTHASRGLSHHARVLALELLNQYEDHVSAISLLKQVLHISYIGDVDTPLFSGLHFASFFGIVELVTALINTESCLINQGDWMGSTPLAWAAWNGREEVVKVLLGRGDIDPNFPDVDARTPLGCAAWNGHTGVVKLLLEREDVGLNPVGRNGLSPLGCAAWNGHEGVVKLLLERKNVDPNYRDVDDRTPLGCAAWNGHEGVVKLLLEREGVDPNLPDKYGQTPLWCAAVDGHESVVKLLLKREDVDFNVPDRNGLTPLGGAACNGHEGVVKLLLDLGDADPDTPDKHGNTPLSHAAWNGYEGVVKLLQAPKSVETGDAHPPHQL